MKTVAMIGTTAVELHQDQRLTPHKQVVHMTEADQIEQSVKKQLANRGRPHMTEGDR
jgi:hypothetical protein